MNLPELIAILTLSLTLTTGIGVLIFRLGRMHYIIEEMQLLVKKIIPMDIMVQHLWRGITTENNSPRVLNEHGKKILKLAKMHEFTDMYFNHIIYTIKKMAPTNAYDAQECLIKVMRELKDNPQCKEDLEERINMACSDVDTILFVGAINIRDRIIDYLGFQRKDIDKFDPQKGTN